MTVAMTYAQLLLQCLREGMAASPWPVPDDRICLRFGAQVAPLLGTQTDECCTGLVWVRVASEQYLTDPDAIVDQGRCITSPKRLTLEMGTSRCIPFGTLQAPPTCDQWTEAALKMDSDLGIMQEAVCCLREMADELPGDPIILAGTYEPTGPDGNCISGTLFMTIDYDCGC